MESSVMVSARPRAPRGVAAGRIRSRVRRRRGSGFTAFALAVLVGDDRGDDDRALDDFLVIGAAL